ncbi:MAG: hypothetical protein ACRECA_09750 [Pseudolabrys sp.]
MKRLIIRATFAGLCALSLAACVDSAAPILTDAKPEFGPRLNLQLYTLRKGVAGEPEKVQFAWNGKLYAHTGGGMKDVSAIALHPFEAGDYIIESIPVRPRQNTEYALLHKLASGAYLVIAIDETNADEATRASNCKHPGNAACRIETREQLLAFAQATAARSKDEGGLVLRLPDASERPARRHKR